MIKTVKLPGIVSTRYPKWYFSCSHYLHQGFDVSISATPKVQISPSGTALLELLRAEAQDLGRTLKGDIPPALQFPVYSKYFCMDWFEGSLKPLFLENFLNLHQNTLTEEEAFDFRLLYSELTQNARDHSGSEKFLVFLTPHELGIFDLGVSIPAKLEQKYNYISDTEALEGALKKGITTRRLRPGGLGLYYTLNQIRERSGTLYLASRNGQIRQYLRNKKIVRQKLEPSMRGTLIHCMFQQTRKKKSEK